MTKKEYDYRRDDIFKWFYVAKETTVSRLSKKCRLKSTIVLGPSWISKQLYDRVDEWTDESPEDLQAQGYLTCTGLHDNIFFWGVPVYLRIVNGKEHVPDPTEPLYTKDTAFTLEDVVRSNATDRFIKGMGHVQLSGMDLGKLGLVAMIAVGAIFGMWMLGVF